MKQFKFLLMMLPLLFLAGLAFAQKKEITGKVIDQTTGLPLRGVSIIAGNEKGGTATNEDGTYSISVGTGIKSITYSYIGYASQTISITEKTSINVSLVSEAITQSELVVIGYGSQKKSSLTGAVSKFKSERLDEAPVSRLDQALQGKIAGVTVLNVSSEAGAPAKVRVRGLSTVNAGASPLVVVDGHPVADGLSFVNAGDVESVEVLKDAASAAIYGSRGASGVILVTTKKGRAEKPKYSLKMSTGTKSAYKMYDIMTASDWLKLLFAEAELKKLDPSVPASQLTITGIAGNDDRAGYIIENDLRSGQSTDWQDEAIRTANIKNIQLSVSGGGKDVKYFISGAYQKDQGMMIHSEYERYSLRSKIDAQLSKRVKVSFNVNPSYAKRETPAERFQDFVRFRSWLPTHLDAKTAAFVSTLPVNSTLKAGDWAQARYFSNLVYSGQMPDGSYWTSAPSTVTPFNTSNQTPLFSIEQQSQTSDEYRVLASGDVTINIIPGLDFKSLASGYVNYSKGLNFSKRDATRAGDVNQGRYDDRLFVDILSENTLNYTKKIKNHSFEVLGGFTAQKSNLREQRATGLDYPSDNVTSLNTALQVLAPAYDANQNPINSYSITTEVGLLSYLGRITYNYKEKYLAAVSFRADGSSKFADGNKWGYFPSISVGWVATKEKFLENVNWLSNLKVRGSYGTTGNNNILDYAFVDLLYGSNYPFGAGTGTSTVGQIPNRATLSNPDITWERTFQFNAGLDLSILKNAVTFSLDVYQSKTDELLLRQAAQAFTGVPFVWNNIGSIQNKGIEFEINSVNYRKKDFIWRTSANISHNKNKVMELGNEAFLLNQGERTEVYMNRVGDPLVQYFGYKTDGVWLSQDQVNAAIASGMTSTLAAYFQPGGLKFKDLNGDNKIDANDRTVIGNPYPDFNWGITNNFNYKGFDLSFLFQGTSGGKLVNGDANYLEIKRTTRVYSDNRWISALNPGDGKTPVANVGYTQWLHSDYALEDASYWALREVILGYTISQKWTSKAKLSLVRFYFSAQNLYYHFAKDFRALNPEARTTSGPYNTPLIDGYQRGAFPVNRTFLFGLDLNF